VKIRNVDLAHDLPELERVFAAQGLPPACFPDLQMHYSRNGKDKGLIANPRYVVKKVVEGSDGRIALAGFAKITSEAYLLLDHAAETPGWRWEALQELTDAVAAEAKVKGIDCLTAYVPNHLIESFGPRLTAMKFIESPWKSYSRLL
jgi:hypothetical protein